MTTKSRLLVPSCRAEYLARPLDGMARHDEFRIEESILDAQTLDQSTVVLRLVHAYRRARNRAREQGPAHIRGVSPPFRDSRAPDEPRRRKRVGQQHRDVGIERAQRRDVGTP